MTWDGWQAFWAMGGYARFVWGAYGVTAAVVVIELMALRSRRRRAIGLARRAGDRDRTGDR
jgi:heme exporter protein D